MAEKLTAGRTYTVPLDELVPGLPDPKQGPAVLVRVADVDRVRGVVTLETIPEPQTTERLQVGHVFWATFGGESK